MTSGSASLTATLGHDGGEAGVLALRELVRTKALDRPGTYRMLAPEGEVLYVGKSKRIRSRLMSYFRCEFPGDKGARLLRESQRIEWDYVPSEFAALIAELRQIKRFRPRYNVQMKSDARHYAFIKLLRGKAPRMTVVRAGTYDEGATYYGPFAGAGRVSEAVRELQDILGLRDCTLDSRMHFSDQRELFNLGERTPGCVRYEIGKCLGPCVGACSASEYRSAVSRAKAFLDGTDSSPIAHLRQQMLDSSERLEFERAASLRDKLERLETLHEQFSKLHFAAESLSFVYAVPGAGGDDRVYLIRRGQVRGETMLPEARADSGKLAALAGEIYAGPTRTGTAIPTHEIDELLLISSWFKRHPRELQRTCDPSLLSKRGVPKSLRKLISAA